MPIYDFKNKETGELQPDVLMSISAMEKYLEDHPEMSLHISSAPEIADPVKLGIRKTPASFRDLLGHIKKKHRRSTIRAD